MTLEYYLRNLGAGERIKLETYDGENEVEFSRNSIGKITTHYSYRDYEKKAYCSGTLFDSATMQNVLKQLNAKYVVFSGDDWIIYKTRAELKAEIAKLKSEVKKLQKFAQYAPYNWELDR